MKTIILKSILFILIAVTLVGAELDIGYDDDTQPKVIMDVPDAITSTNVSMESVNSSDYWDNLDTPIDINFDDLTWLFGNNWNYISTGNFYFNESKLSTTYYNATQSEIKVGNVDEGILAYTHHEDGDYDDLSFNFSESAGSPALDMRMNFTNVPNFNGGVMRYKTSSLKGDYPLVQLWSYTENGWHDYPPIADSEGNWVAIKQGVWDAEEHIQDNVIQMRIYKESSGNTNNKYYIDWIAVYKGYGTPVADETDPISFHRNNNINNSGYNVSAEYFKGDGSQLTGISVEDIYVNETGDTMTGDLDISGGANISMGKNSKFLGDFSSIIQSERVAMQDNAGGSFTSFSIFPPSTNNPTSIAFHSNPDDLSLGRSGSIGFSPGLGFMFLDSKYKEGGMTAYDMVFRLGSGTPQIAMRIDNSTLTVNHLKNIRVGATSGESITLDGDDAYIQDELEVGGAITINGSINDANTHAKLNFTDGVIHYVGTY